MNFFGSAEYLDVVSEVYFPGRTTRVADVLVGDECLRLLVVDDREVVCDVTFMDYHRPLSRQAARNAERRRVFVPAVERFTIAAETRARYVRPGVGVAPFVDWSSFGSYGDYEALYDLRHPGKARQLRRQRRRLERIQGALEFTFDDARIDVLPTAIAWKRAQLIATGHRGIFADPRNALFFDKLRDRGLLVSCTLRTDGRLVAASLGCVWGGVSTGWISAYDPSPELRKYSPGHQLLRSALAYSFAAVHREFDFSVGGFDYKWHYATHARILGPLGSRPATGKREAIRRTLGRMGLLQAARAVARTVRRH